MNSNRTSLLCAAGAVLSWSTVATAFKIALRELSVYEMLLVAATTSLLIFTVFITIQRNWKAIFRLSRGSVLTMALMGLLNPVAYYLILFKSYSLLPAQIAQPINYIWPIMLLVLLALFAHQPIPKMKYIGMFISLLGVTVISLGGSATSSMDISVLGLGLASFSALLWAVYWMVNNRSKSSVDTSVSLFMTFLFGVIYLFAGLPFADVEISSLQGVLSGMYVGTFEMGLPFILFALAMRKTTNHALIDQLCYLAPFLSLFFISIVLGEKIVLTTYIGLVFIVGGIVYNQYFVKGK